jgi:hypothetical protein
MLHAIFAIFECHCDYGCKVKGREYHGIPWQAAAQAIEKSTVLGWYFDLGRIVSLVYDMYISRISLPKAAMLRSLDLDICEILVKQQETRVVHNKPLENNGPFWAKERWNMNLRLSKSNWCTKQESTVDAAEDAEYEEQIRRRNYFRELGVD